MPVLHTDSTYTILLVSYVHTCSTWCYLSVFFACFVLTGSSITDHPIRFCSENNVLCTLVRLLVLTGFDFFSSAVCVKVCIAQISYFSAGCSFRPVGPSVARSVRPSVRPSVHPSVCRYRTSALAALGAVFLVFHFPFFHRRVFFRAPSVRCFPFFGWAASLQGVRAIVLLRVQPLPGAAPAIVRHPRPAEAVPAVQRPSGSAPGDACG